jgi:hypothetical protein
MEFIVLFLLIVDLFVFLNIKSVKIQKQMSVLLMEETGLPGENHRPAASSAALLLLPLYMYIHCFSELRRIILK